MSPRLDVANVIDAAPVSALQIRIFILCGLVAVLDGVDSQVIGVAGPLIAADLGLAPAAFAPAFSAGLLGAALGAVLFGPLADRIGRKPMLVLATILFGAFTCLTVMAVSFPMLLVYRFIAGLGLGGAIPCFIALGAEYAPARRRAMCTTLLWAGYPLGLSIGGFMSSHLISNFDWPVIFYAGGVPTLITAMLLLAFMPESLRFLVSKGKTEAVERILHKLDKTLPEGALEPIVHGESVLGRSSISTIDLFREGRAAATVLLGLTLFLAFAATTVIVLQVPTLLRTADVPLGTSAFLVGIYSLSAVVAMAISGRLMEKVGPVSLLVSVYVCGGALLAILGHFAASPVAAAVIMALIGLTIPLGAAGSLALTAIHYPTAMRSAGTGWVMGLGRFGQFLSPLLVGLMLHLAWSPAAIFAAMGVAPLLAGLCVGLYGASKRPKAAVRPPLVAGE